MDNDIIESDKPVIDQTEELKYLATQINSLTNVSNIESEDGDSFYKHSMKSLFSIDNLSAKTEYLTIKENFAGTKLQFLGDYAGFPFMSEFMQIFEQKRISLERKGRKEIIMALQERHREEQRIREEKINNMATGVYQ